MKKLYALVAIPLLAFGVGYAAHQPQTKESKQTITKTQTVQAAEPIYYLGDRQSDPDSYMTLTAVHAQQQTTEQMSANPVDAQVVTFQLDTNVDQTQLMHQAIIYTSDGQYLKPTSGPYQVDCNGTCVSFVTSPNIQIDTFIYKNFRWYL